MPPTLSAERKVAALRALPRINHASLDAFNSSSAAAGACEKHGYEKIPGDQLSTRPVRGQVITYASPDSTYAVTRRLIESAERSVVIGIYDFTAGYVKELLLRAMRRGVRVSLMLDLNGRQGERTVFNQLRNRGAEAVAAPSCSGRGNRPHFDHAHEKIIVVDGEWTMVQSGNWSEASAPFNETDGVVIEPGNRDAGIAVKSPELADFFTRLIKADMRLELGQHEAEVLLSLTTQFREEEVFVAAPPQVPAELFPSKTFPEGAPVPVRPVLTPDNYMDVVPEFLRSARRSVRIEQQYIRAHQPTIKLLLDAIRKARRRNPALSVRIIVSPKDDKVRRMRDVLASDYDLHAPHDVRLLSGTHFVHCHNKLIVVDDERVLVGSQNWSTTAVTSNREASLLVESEAVASYFAAVFDADWRMSEPESDAGLEASFEGASVPRNGTLFAPPAFSSGLVIPLSPSDYADV